MEINNISDLDNATSLLNKDYLTNRIQFYNNKLEKLIIVVNTSLAVYISFITLIYSNFLIKLIELQITLTIIGLLIFFVIIGMCEYNYKFYSYKKKTLFHNIKNNKYSEIYEDLFCDQQFDLINLKKFFPWKTILLFGVIILTFYYYLYHIVCDSSFLSLCNLILKNYLYFFNTLIIISIIVYLPLLFILLKHIDKNNKILRQFLFFILPLCSFIFIIYMFNYFYQSAWNFKINLEKGHTLLYSELSHNINKKLERSVAIIKIIPEEKSTENCTQDDFIKTAIYAAKKYKEEYQCDITKVYLVCYKIENGNFNRFYATVTYIPDGKGMSGKGNNSPRWVHLLSFEKGFTLAELEDLKNYDMNRSCYDEVFTCSREENQKNSIDLLLRKEPRLVTVDTLD